jgi:hypothetical protein
MESGDLLRLAQCACAEQLDPESMDALEVMLAGWSIRGESLEGELGEEAEGAMGDLLGGEAGEFLGGFVEAFGGLGDEWLDRCGIDLQRTPAPY